MENLGYLDLFGTTGEALTDADWIDRANRYRTPNLVALNAFYEAGSSKERWLRMTYRPGSAAMNFAQLSGGSIAEMLDQTATHCGSLVTRWPCPTISMNITILRGARTASYSATGHILKLSRSNALLAADLDDETGTRIATATIVSYLLTDPDRLSEGRRQD